MLYTSSNEIAIIFGLLRFLGLQYSNLCLSSFHCCSLSLSPSLSLFILASLVPCCPYSPCFFTISLTHSLLLPILPPSSPSYTILSLYLSHASSSILFITKSPCLLIYLLYPLYVLLLQLPLYYLLSFFSLFLFPLPSVFTLVILPDVGLGCIREASVIATKTSSEEDEEFKDGDDLILRIVVSTSSDKGLKALIINAPSAYTASQEPQAGFSVICRYKSVY